MVSILELLNSRLPILKFFEEKFKDKYGIETYTGHWNESYYVYIFISSLVHVSLVLYSFYLLFTCLKEQKQQGSGLRYVNGFCDVLFACFCMPCYIIYRGFVNPCKIQQTEKVVKETLIVSQPTAAPSPYPGQPTQPTSTLVTTPSGIVTSQPILPAAVPVKTTTTNRIVGGGKKEYNKNKIKKTNKLNI